MIKLIRRSRKQLAIFFVLLMFFQVAQIPATYALTSGPSQPEMQSFQPAGVSDMVDLFTGDFSYNIPLFELPGPNGGYPFNLSYQSGITMDQEASWVGLGFSLNPGAINRQMRGLPDEFKGDEIYTKMSIKPSVTVGLSANADVEVFGAANLGLGLSVSQNNYKGFGYSIDGSTGFGRTLGRGMTGGIGLRVSLDPKEGIGVNPNLTLGTEIGDFGIGAGYNSKQGLNSVNLSYVNDLGPLTSRPIILGTSISLLAQGYTPQVSMPMRNMSIAAEFKAGSAWWGIFLNATIEGFYSEQWLKEDQKRVESNAFGYMNYQFATADRDVLDFNREKDGIVSKETPNLAIPSLTYDIYSVTGQGVGAMYRPKRNDYGIVRDPETVSKSTGGSAGIEGAPTLVHAGVNLTLNYSESKSGKWSDRNDMAGAGAFTKSNVNKVYEPWYFKVHGEPTSESMETLQKLGGDEAVRVQLKGTNSEPEASQTLERNNWNAPLTAINEDNGERKPRNQVIQSITNDELLTANGTALNALFKVTYKGHNGTLRNFDRTTLPGHHPAGLTALTPGGLRYNYAIPAYNNYREDVIYSTDKQAEDVSRVNVCDNGNCGGENGDPPYAKYDHTDQYLKRVEIPAYAHSYLLTSIVGPDYVDVTGDGVSEDDLGYWVKFTYQKTTSEADPYKWRDPYSRAHFIEGWETDPRDDKGQFVYGKKDIWYLTQAETKSHIATFTLQDRNDGRGVATKLQDSNDTGKTLKSLSQIKLYSRASGNNYTIKTVNFHYDYSLCQGVYNNPSGEGKLTLKKVWFEYGNSRKGQFNPYVFTYHQSNPSYDNLAYDRWGNYKPYPPNNYEKNKDFPYVEQNPLQKATIDANVASWSLSKIQLPSGAEMRIDYETDDYAYVQHKAAMQMMPMVDPDVTSDLIDENANFNLNDGNAKVRFRLEQPIPDEPGVDQQAAVIKYLDTGNEQIYFKSKINLRSPGEGFHEFISGYADIDFNQPMGLEKGASGNFVYGYFYLKKENGYHPLSMRAWQHIRVNQPDLANSGRTLKQTNSNAERVHQIKSLGSIFAQLRQMFQGFYPYCDQKDWGREVVANNAWIRLKSPDKVKYGGGLRVRQITLKDQWQDDKDGIYGQVYDYTMQEDGASISSGVAAYEPLIGGEENALRYAKKYTESIPLRADNNLFFEYPINESYYPGPQVGYRQVSVLSLASAFLAGMEVKHVDVTGGGFIYPDNQQATFGSSGMTVHEFYTAKDFPVITDETDKKDKPYQLSVPVPFLGQIEISKLASSQGYSVITNDMHGKQKKIGNYRQDSNGDFEEKPISFVQYNYLTTERLLAQEAVNEVNSIFKENSDGTLSVAASSDLLNPGIVKYVMGQESEFFMDMRHFDDTGWRGGVRLNIDMVMIPIIFVLVPVLIPSTWPNVSKTSRKLWTASTNKVIFRKGILESVDAYDGGSFVKTTHLKWNKLTGNPVLTSVNNNFDEPVYQYNIPAFTQYQGMGAAYKNIGAQFSVEAVRRLSEQDQATYEFSTVMDENALFPGDEIFLYSSDSEFKEPLVLAVYLGKEDGVHLLHSEGVLEEDSYDAMLIRSGRRNQLEVDAGNMTALNDPSIPGIEKTYNKTIVIPNR